MPTRYVGPRFRRTHRPPAPGKPRPEAFIRRFGERVFLANPAAGSVTIGRSDDCDIVVNEHSVSRAHATLYFSDAVIIKDTGSSYGTRVGAVELRAGQRSQLFPGLLCTD